MTQQTQTTGPCVVQGPVEYTATQELMDAVEEWLDWFDECAWLFGDLATDEGAAMGITQLRTTLRRLKRERRKALREGNRG